MIQRINLTEQPDWIGASWGVIDAIMEGDQSVEILCKAWGMTQGMFYRTTMKHPELKEAFTLARRVRAQRYVDQAIELTRPAMTTQIITYEKADPKTGDITTVSEEREVSADWDRDHMGRYTANSGLIQRDALRIKTLLHLASRLDPEQYGDRIIEDHRSEGKAMLVIGDTARAAELIKRAREARLHSGDDAATLPSEEKDVEAGSNPAHAALTKDDKPDQTPD